MADQTMLHDSFLRETSAVVGGEMDSFLTALESPAPTSVRYNPYKIDSPPDGLSSVGWCRYGYHLEVRPNFTLDPYFHGGVYYVQESSSMFVEHLLRSSFEDLEGLHILDMCAAPGGKSTLYSTLVGPGGVVVANEVIRSRANILSDNAKKWGLSNIVVTNNDPSHFEKIEHLFDVVAIDAPCSGEGMFRKSKEARLEWSPESVNLCAQRQRRIVSDAWQTLKPGGVMIYSTCTFNRVENEQNIEWIVDEFGAEPITVEVDHNWNIVCTEASGVNCFRFYPHRVSGEGFFAAILRKPEDRIKPRAPKSRKQIFSAVTKQEVTEISKMISGSDYMQFTKIGNNIYSYFGDTFTTIKSLAESLTVIYSGVVVGELFGRKLKPEHSLAMYHDLNLNHFNVAELDLESSLRYLRKQDIALDDLAEGLNLVQYNGISLGWIRRISGRSNNLYPKESRIIK